MAPDQTPGEYASVTCVLPDCGEPLAIRWELFAPLVYGELEPDADPLVPGDSVAGDWEVRCLGGHVILRPGEKYCPGDTDLCGDDLCDHDHDDDLRQWRRSDVERLTALLRSAGVLPAAEPVTPAEPDPFDHVLTIHSTYALTVGHPDSCDCSVILRLARGHRRARDLPGPGRYQVGINDLGDRLLIGDRIGGTDGAA